MSRDGSNYQNPSGGPVTPGSNTTSATYGPNSDSSYQSQVGIDSSFRFRVRAENGAGSSSWTYTGTVNTDPIPPHKPRVNRPDSGTFELTIDIKSDIADVKRIEAREDTGSGYGAWTHVADANQGSESWISGSNQRVKGNTVTYTFKVGQSYDSSLTFSNDARYQFRIREENNDYNNVTSEWVYADYGNAGNVYFSDDFESNDLSAWSGDRLLSDSQSGVQSGSVTKLGISGADQGTYYLRLDSGDYVATPDFDGTGSDTDLIVRSVVATGSMDNSGEQVHIQVIDRNDADGWHTIDSFSHEYNKQGWLQITAIIPSQHVSSSMAVRPVGYGGGGDLFAVDSVVVSDILHEYTTPPAHTNLSLDTSVEDEITAMWTDNRSLIGINPNPYTQAYIKETSASSFTEADEDRLSESYTYTNLSDGEAYDIEVDPYYSQPRHGSLNEWWHASQSAGQATTLLPAPTGLSASNIGSDTVDLSWTENHDYGDQRVYLRQTGQRAGMSFTANGDNIEIADNAHLDGFDNGFTVTGWLYSRQNNVGDYTFLWYKGEGWSGATIWPIIDGINADTFDFYPGFTDSNDNTYRVSVNNNPHREWVFWAFKYDPSTGDLTTRVNSDANTQTISTGLTVNTNNSDIRFAQGGNGGYLDGVESDCRIYNRPLSSTELDTLQSGGTVSDGLVGYWPLDQNNSGTTPDVSPYSNDGTVNGATLVGNTPTDDSGSLALGTTTYTLSGLEDGEQYEAFVQAETEHSKTRDQ